MLKFALLLVTLIAVSEASLGYPSNGMYFSKDKYPYFEVRLK